MRAGFRVIAPDLRGYGESPKPRGVENYELPLIVDDVAALIESHGGSCILVGHDWGAFTAWFVTMMRPDLVRKLVILNVPHPAAFSRELHRRSAQKLRVAYQALFQLPVIPELLMRAFGRWLLSRLGPFTKEQLDDYARAWRGSLTPMFDWYRALRRSRGKLKRLMRRIDAPVLVIWGTREPVFVKETLENVGEWVPDLCVEKIEGAGHFVQHEAAGRVTELLLEFM